MTDAKRCWAMLVASAICAAMSCSERTSPATPTRPGPGIVLQVDGLQIHQDEIAALVAQLEQADQSMGRKAAIRSVLDGHLVPLKLAQRDLAAERSEQHQRARALATAVGNGGYPALRAMGKAAGSEKTDTTRHELPLPVASWVFDRENIGLVSPIIETPQGFTLASTYHIEPGTTRIYDRAHAFQATFYTHSPAEFAGWLDARRAGLAAAVQYVDPDYADSLPQWLTP